MTSTAEQGAMAASAVEEFGRRFLAGDRDGAMGMLHSGFRIQQPASLPHGGWHHGAQGMAKMGSIFSRYWERTISDAQIMPCGDGAMQITTQTWTAKDTGRKATVDVLELFKMSDGLISEIRVFQQDTHLLMSTLASSGS
ncbi:MAG: nuclear transport factor 2 family protein [Acidimicrobiaceae bacterium]|nr:nuclear transport factor 2 family protein [Acidimicrobiaceae bacterium]